jgi:hypothetical protein
MEVCGRVRSQKESLRHGEGAILDFPEILFFRPDPAGINPKGEFAGAPVSVLTIEANSPFETTVAAASNSIYYPHFREKNPKCGTRGRIGTSGLKKEALLC